AGSRRGVTEPPASAPSWNRLALPHSTCGRNRGAPPSPPPADASARAVGAEHGPVVDGPARAAEVDTERGHVFGRHPLRALPFAAEQDRRRCAGRRRNPPPVLRRDGLDEANDARLRRRVGRLLGRAALGALPRGDADDPSAALLHPPRGLAETEERTREV